jgi:hypothetical protein
MVFAIGTLQSSQEPLEKQTLMKINEITKGNARDFAKYLGANIAKQLGSSATTNAILNGMSSGSFPLDSPTFFKDPTKVAKTVDTLSRAAKNAGGKLSPTDIGQILSKRLPTAWRAETNKTEVINAFAAELQRRGVQIGDTPPAPAQSAWKMGDPIPQPDGSVITVADGQLYKQVASQYQKT